MPTLPPSSDIEVRPLVAGDEPQWRTLFDGYIAFYDAPVGPEVIDLTWKRLLAGEGGMLGLGAVAPSSTLVGIAHVLFHSSTWSPTGYCYLEDLFVTPSARGHGVGRKLVEAVYRIADARGATRTYWVTGEDNLPARSLYDALARRAPFIQYRR